MEEGENMGREKFIEKFDKAPIEVDKERLDKIVDACIRRNNIMHPEFGYGGMVTISLMEEMAEFTQALSMRMRGRTEDNYDIIQELADVFLYILCVCRVYNISAKDLKKAINVKIEREEKRRGWTEPGVYKDPDYDA